VQAKAFPAFAQADHEKHLRTYSLTQKDIAYDIGAPVMALDLGQKRVGVALSDALRISVRRLDPLKRSNWKRLLSEVTALTRRFDAKTLVIGLPLSLDGTMGSAAAEVERIARNFVRSLEIPVFLQDERLSSVQARANLRNEGVPRDEIANLLDSEAAAVILRDFLSDARAKLPLTAERAEPQEETE